MMKIMLSSMSVYVCMKKIQMNIMSLTLVTIITITMLINNKIMIMSQYWSLDQLSLFMMLLTLMSTLLIIISTNIIKEITKTILPILLILMIAFSMYNMLYFYIMFELVLMPTMILITKSGKQPERLQAGIYLIMYTISASLPLLVSIIFIKNNMSFLITNICLFKFKFITLMMMAFLVKMPMYFTHLWLPKAHVEAPLEGSMILAAILLKLGGYGLIRFFPLYISKIMSMNYWIVSISIIGATATGINCIRQKDLKSLIAYSSVAHMGLVLSSIFVSNQMGLHGAVIMMVAHGLTSSALFLLVNDIYLKTHARNMFMLKGMMTIFPNMMFWWFIFMAANMSAPPMINTLSEIFIMTSMILWSSITIIPIMLASSSTASFSLSMFINMYHNKNEMSYFKHSNQKIFLSLFMHLIPLFMILMKMEMFNM